MISTVNVQHLESLNDAVFEITDVRVRETFPDRILDEADEVVLVDLTPEALRERIAAGKVYAPDRAEVALQNFFRLDNLAALRELVLRELAEDVEARRTHDDPRPAQPAGRRRADPRAGHAGAALAADPAARVALVAAARLGARRALGAQARASELSEQEAAQLAALRRLASVLGAHFIEETGDDLVAAVKRVRGRARLDLRVRRHARTSRGGARSCAGRSSRRSCASCPASTSASSPTARSARSASGDGRRSIARSSAVVVVRDRRCRPGAPAQPAPRSTAARAPGASSCRSRAARSSRRCSRRRSGSRAPRRRRSCPPTCSSSRSSCRPTRRCSSRSRSRCRCSRRSRTPSLRAGVPVDARVESGRSPIHALQRLWEVEHFDRIVAPGPGGRERPGFTPKDLTWMLVHAPSEPSSSARPRRRRFAAKVA